jgi:hypothetical protein
LLKIYTVLNGEHEGKGLAGIAMCRWQKNIKIDLKETNREDVSEINVTRNTIPWQGLVNTAVKLLLNNVEQI